MALFNVLFDIAARTASIESSLNKVERRFDSVARYAKSAGALIGVSFGAAIFQQGIAGAIELGDEMGKLADKTGLTASAASELSRVFKQNDLDNSALASSMRKMQVEISKGADVFDKLGLSAATLKNQAADKSFEDIAQAISLIPNAADRAAAAVKIFGKSGTDLLPILLQGKSGIQELRKELGGLSDEDVRQLQNADDAIKKLSFLKQSFWNNIAVGVVSVGEAFGWMAKEANIQVQEDLNDALRDRQKIMKELQEVMSNRIGRGQSSNAWGVSELKDLGAQLSAVEKRIADINQRGLSLDKKTAITGIASSVDPEEETEGIKKTAEALDYVTVSAQRGENAALAWVLAWSEINSTVLDGIEAFGELDSETQKSFKAMADGVEIVTESVKQSGEEIKPWAEEMNRSMTAAFSDAFYNIGSGASNFADDLINAFKRVLANEATSSLFNMLAGMGESSGGSWWGAALSSIFGGARANGGPVSAGSAYLVGERGPEIFMPGSSGAIAPNAAMAGGVNYAPVYNIDARGATQDLAKMLPSILKAHASDTEARIITGLRNNRYGSR